MSSIPYVTQNVRAFCTEGRLKQAQHILLTTHQTSVYSSTYLLHVFTPHKTLTEGKQIHSQINDRGYISATNTFWQNRLINMYDKCGSLVDARLVFNHITEGDVFSWNMIIAGYQRHGIPQEAFTLFHQMQRTAVKPDHFTFSTLLPVCTNASSLKHGLQMHGKIVRCGFQFDVIVMNTLIDMYAKCGRMQKAIELFDKMPQRDVVSFIAIIAGFTQIGLAKQALGIFKQMQLAGIKPNSATLASIVSACAKMEALDQGMEIHKKIIENGLLSNVVVVTALVDMYAKCGSIQKAQGLFDEIPQRDVTSWNVMIAGYTHNGLVDKAFNIFRQVQVAGVKPNSTTFASFLPACAQAEALEQGMEIHQKIIKCGFLSTVIVANSLLDMYAKCGSIQKATQLFDKMHQQDLASWNGIIVAYAQNGLFNKSLEFFTQMQLAGIKSDTSTFASILTACTKLGALIQGMQIHQKVIKTGFLSDVVVVTALIDIYAKCGSIQKAQELFDKMPSRDVASWNAIIVGYAQNGLVDKALDIFKQIQLGGIKPDSLTFASILPACAKIGALEQGMGIHQKIIKNGLFADAIVNSLIDMYAKCGSVQKALVLFDKMPQKNVISWTAMIAGCAMHGYSKDSLKLFELMKQSGTDPNHVSFLCVLFACSHAGLVDSACKYFNCMSDSYCIIPTMDHYVCMVDLLGRAGHLEQALNFIIKIPLKTDVGVWMCLLGACRSHKNIGLGEFVATLLFELDPKNAAPYVLWSNIYAEAGRWGDVHKVRKLMKERGIRKLPGCSWIEVHKMVHAFCVEDRSHLQTQKMHLKLE